MPADDASDHAVVREAVDAAPMAVSHARDVDHREVPRMALAQEATLKGRQDETGLVDATARAVHEDRGAIGYEGAPRPTSG